MEKFVNVYNESVTQSPLYSTLDQLIHRNNDEPFIPINVTDFWQEIETCLWNNGDFTATIKIYPVILA